MLHVRMAHPVAVLTAVVLAATAVHAVVAGGTAGGTASTSVPNDCTRGNCTGGVFCVTPAAATAAAVVASHGVPGALEAMNQLGQS